MVDFGQLFHDCTYFLMFSIGSRFNVFVFVCSVLSWCLLKDTKILCVESQKEDGTKELADF
jgi:hypothetical protein